STRRRLLSPRDGVFPAVRGARPLPAAPVVPPRPPPPVVPPAPVDPPRPAAPVIPAAPVDPPRPPAPLVPPPPVPPVPVVVVPSSKAPMSIAASDGRVIALPTGISACSGGWKPGGQSGFGNAKPVGPTGSALPAPTT